mmetsp:Transcript_1402/g.4301  ORF Transcript_1402/g.4301 Transcript_1402/m.4301 type:complete len:80 (-) Transcript_1402:366-605(-)
MSLLRAGAALVRTRPAALAPRRWMGGKMDIKKNYFVEEWNGKREITEKSFDYTWTNTPVLIATLFLFPAGVYFLCKGQC